MNREKLIFQVKELYAKIADDEGQQHFSQTTVDLTPEAYYENILDMVIAEIGAGTFDSFHSGQEIVDAVANDKKKWLSRFAPKEGTSLRSYRGVLDTPLYDPPGGLPRANK